RAGDWPRRLHGEVIRRLSAAGARLIVYDVHFSVPSRDPAEDLALEEALEAARDPRTGVYRVILPVYLDGLGHTVRSLSRFAERSVGEGAINVVTDRDGVLRRMPVLTTVAPESGEGPALALSLALEAARQAVNAEEVDTSRPDSLGLASWQIPVRDGLMLINFAGGPGTFPIVPVWRVLAGEIHDATFRDRIVLVGTVHPSSHDRKLTPFHRPGVLSDVGVQIERAVPTYGVEVHANALATVLDGRFLRRLRPAALAVALAGAGLVAGAALATLTWHPPGSLGIWLLLAAGTAGLALWAFEAHGLWLDVVPLQALFVCVLGATLALQWAEAVFRRQQVARVFSRYVSREVVRQLVENPLLVQLGGREAILTVFFSDIRGFTTISERMAAGDVARILNEYLGAMTEIIFEYGGTLDKFMGDAVMAFWGDPVPQPDHALRAVRAAVAMRERLHELCAAWTAEGLPRIAVGIGLNTGRVVVGNLGSADFVDYTVIGDDVNLACRLEQVAHADQILLSDATYQEIAPWVDAKELEPIRVKGREAPVRVWELAGLRERS
ncbi:MAG: CHASE2 domain-containing protein, partial [Candidatus Rokuibacteriota bacterium]